MPCRYKKKLILFPGLAEDEKALERAQRGFLSQIMCRMCAVGPVLKLMWKEPRIGHNIFLVTSWYMMDCHTFAALNFAFAYSKLFSIQKLIPAWKKNVLFYILSGKFNILMQLRYSIRIS